MNKKNLLFLAIGFILFIPAKAVAQTQNIFNAYPIEWSDNIFELDSLTKNNLEQLQAAMYVDPDNPNYDISGYSMSFWIEFADFDNDGEDELFRTIWSHPESNWVYGVFDYDSTRNVWISNPDFTIYAYGDGNSRFSKKSLGDFDGDGLVDVLRETVNFHGRLGVQPDWYLENGYHTPNEIFLNRQSTFERVELDTSKSFDNICNCEDYLNTQEHGILLDVDQDGKDEAIILYNSRVQDEEGNNYLAKRYDYDNGEIIATPFIKNIFDNTWEIAIEYLVEENGYYYYLLQEQVYWNFDKNIAEEFNPDNVYPDSMAWAYNLYFMKSPSTEGIVLDTTKVILQMNPSMGVYLQHEITDFNQNGIEDILVVNINNDDGRTTTTYIFENGVDITSELMSPGFNKLMTANPTIRVVDMNQDGLPDLIGDIGWQRLADFPGDTPIPDNLSDLHKYISEKPGYTFDSSTDYIPYVPYVQLNLNGRLVPHEIILDEEFQRNFYGTGFVPLFNNFSISDQSTSELIVEFRKTHGPGTIEDDERNGAIFVDIKFESMITVSNERSDVSPKSYSLSQNYPNPFNPTTAIQFALPQTSAVRLEVFNMLGQSVGVLVDGVQQAGSHTVNFDASGLSTGVYFYRLVTPQYSETRQMMLIK